MNEGRKEGGKEGLMERMREGRKGIACMTQLLETIQLLRSCLVLHLDQYTCITGGALAEGY